jgi:ATP-binding cassette subfamily B protein
MFPGITCYLPSAQTRRRITLIALTAAVLQALLQLAIPFSVNYVFRNILPQKSLAALAWSGLVLFLLYAGQASVIVTSRLTILEITKSATSDLRRALVAKLYSLTAAFLRKSDRGHLHNTLVQDTERADIMANGIAAEVIPSCATIMLLCGYLLTAHWIMFLATSVLVGPAILVSHGILKPRLQHRVRIFHRSFARFGRAVYRLLELIDLTHTLAAEESEKRRFARQAEELRHDSLAVVRLSVWTNSLQQTVFPAIGIAILTIGGALAANSQLATGELVSFYVAVGMLRTPFATLLAQYPRIMEGRAAMDNICSLLSQSEVIVYQGTQQVSNPSAICLEGVRFGYNGLSLFNDITLTLERGITVAITGANGTGKSTLLQLLTGLERPSGGRVCADNVPYDQIEMVSLRRSLGVVPQHPRFFDGTIRENITFGRQTSDDQQIVDAAAMACAHEFISELPDGYETFIGDDGVRLSGGQRQRLAMARAFLDMPQFVFLDEPSNHLEKHVLSAVLDNLRQASVRPCILLISHDPGVLIHADLVYRLQYGRLSTEKQLPHPAT